MSYCSACPPLFSVEEATEQVGGGYGELQGIRGQPERVYSRVFSPPSLRLFTKEKQQVQTSKKQKCAEGSTPSKETWIGPSFLLAALWPSLAFPDSSKKYLNHLFSRLINRLLDETQGQEKSVPNSI